MGLSGVYQSLDVKWIKMKLNSAESKGGLWIFMLHALFRDKQEFQQDYLFPHEYMTVSQFRKFIEYYLKNDFQFISPNQLSQLSNSSNKYALITFDGGYYNNHLALPVLEELRIPAVFNITTDYVDQPRSFWWDVHFRECKKRGIKMKKILAEQNELKKLSHFAIEDKLKSAVGEHAFHVIGDIDRPFEANELQDFAKSRYVYLGNHTHHHAILPHLSYDAMTREVEQAQTYLYNLTGKRPSVIAYPNGNFSEKIIPFMSAQFLQSGFTVIPGINPLSSLKEVHQALQLKRFQPNGIQDIVKQCIQFHGYSHSVKNFIYSR